MKKSEQERVKRELIKEYKKHYKRIKGYIKKYQQIGWLDLEKIELPTPKEFKQKPTKKELNKVARLYNKEFSKKYLKELVDYSTGELLKGKKAGEFSKKKAKELKEEKKKTRENAVVFIGIIDTIRNIINNLPDERYFAYGHRLYTGGLKNELLSIINEKESINKVEYANYLKQHEYELISESEVIYLDSSQVNVEAGIARFARILNQGELSPLQEDKITDYLEFLTSV